MKINEVRELSTSELKEKLYSLKEQLSKNNSSNSAERKLSVLSKEVKMSSQSEKTSPAAISFLENVNSKRKVNKED